MLTASWSNETRYEMSENGGRESGPISVAFTATNYVCDNLFTLCTKPSSLLEAWQRQLVMVQDHAMIHMDHKKWGYGKAESCWAARDIDENCVRLLSGTAAKNCVGMLRGTAAKNRVGM